MSGVTLTGAFTDPDGDLPSASGLKAQLLGLADLISWHQGDAASVTYGTSPKVASWTCLKGSGRTFTQATSANQGTLTAAQVNGFSGVVMDGASDYYGVNSGYSIDTTNTYTIVAMVKPAAASRTQIVIAPKDASSYIEITPTGVAFTNGGQASILGAYQDGNPHLIIAGYNKTRAQTRLRVDGVNSGLVAATGLASTTLSLGALYNTTPNSLYFGGSIEDILIFAGTTGDVGDIFQEPAELALVEEYMTTVYGLGFTPYGS